MKKRSEQGRALFYSRDSGGRHEATPPEYVRWAERRAAELGLQFDGTPEAIQEMIQSGESVRGDIFFDFSVPGNILSRKGLDALRSTAKTDLKVSHIFSPKRNRLARPDNATDGINLENDLRKLGITLVFMDRSLEPLKPRQRMPIGELVMAAIDYDRSAEDRRELAQKIIYAHIRLAKDAYSTGGQPPYGFRRWLVNESGEALRELEKGEIVRRQGHHVVWLPSDDAEWTTIHRILELLKTNSAHGVAKILTSEGIPTPNHGRYRTDNGVPHTTNGRWNQTTIINIARNPLLVGVMSYGRRAMGDQLRATPNGPRELTDSDLNEHSNSPKVVRNSNENLIEAQAKFEPRVDPIERQALIDELDRRGGTQRGKPRSRNPAQNPLGVRLFDMTCGWPMYRIPYKGSFRYRCGLYSQSCGGQCHHNHVDGVVATKFALNCVRQKLLSPTVMPKLEKRLRELSERNDQSDRNAPLLAKKQRELSELQDLREKSVENMGRAKNDAQYNALAKRFDQLEEQIASIESAIKKLEDELHSSPVGEDEVAMVMAAVHQLSELAGKADNLELARQIFQLTNLRMFMRFRPTRPKKRVINKLVGGVVTFGDAASPVEIYEGATAHKEVRSGAKASDPLRRSDFSDGENKSLRNVSRGDTI
ncbi:recombinase family protein [Bremerella alba]|uniref:Recombinase domain-containing protein n=1 Tax=Bremerella alba TaxID=980252 RepID=A0A7V9A883_9BACT|nr:recombinase family protein [Bremerella alba]MBA2116147.1 hypothetical protein [Bremerella alba]